MKIILASGSPRRKELLLDDKTHEIITGLSVIVEKDEEYKEYKTFDKVKVYFKDISDTEIEKWLNTGNAMDKDIIKDYIN